MQYAFAGTVPVIEYDYDSGQETRTVARQYYWGLGLPGGNGALLYMKVPGSPADYYYYHYDGSCNVTCITDSDKEIKALYEYDAFGNIITKCGSLANDFLFSTQMANTSSGWYMYMFRSYSPSLGRWTQRDSIRDQINTYEFCSNNGLNYIDCYGMWELELYTSDGKPIRQTPSFKEIFGNSNPCHKALYAHDRAQEIMEGVIEIINEVFNNKFAPEWLGVILSYLNLVQDMNKATLGDLIYSYWSIDSSGKWVIYDVYRPNPGGIHVGGKDFPSWWAAEKYQFNKAIEDKKALGWFHDAMKTKQEMKRWYGD
jgi:RHS repeat-associated protein